MTTRTLPNGSIFAERYRILRRIGGGGMGDVYEVLHLETNRRRALKVMQGHILTNSGMCERFRREAKITAGIESEFLVDVIDAGVDEATGLPFLVMELLRGEELKKHLERASRLSPTDVVFFLRQAALALDKTHKAGIVHRDLKPDNLFLTQREDGSPRLKVLDFGIAKILAGEGANPYATREMMGTPFYMAPEQFNLDRPVSAAADIYSIGMIAYTLLVGAPYWKDEPAAANALMFAAVAGNGPQVPASIRARRRGVPLPPAFDAWFARVAAVDPEDRYPTALLAVDALADALGVHRAGQTGLPASSPRAAPPPPNPPRPFGATLPMNPRPSMPYSPPVPAASAPGASAPRASAPYASPPGAFAPRPSAPRPPAPRPSAPRPPAPRASAPRPSAPRPSAPRESAPRASGWPAVGVIVRTGPQKAETDTFTNSLSSAKTIPVGAAARDRRIALIAGVVGIILTLGVTVFLLVSRATMRAGQPEARLTSNQAIPVLRDVPRPKPSPPPPGDAAPEASPPAPSALPSVAPPKPTPKPPPKTTSGAKPAGGPAPSPTPKGTPQQPPRTKPKTGVFGF